MKRLLPAFLLVFLAVPTAFAIVTDRAPLPQSGDRIGILMMPERYAGGTDGAIVSQVRRYLREELQHAGFQSFDAARTYDDLHRNDEQNADYYIEIVSADGSSKSHDLGSIQGQEGGVELALTVARIAAAIRVYDGHTLELLHTYDLKGKCRAVVPADIDMGVRGLVVWLAVPFIEHAQYRAAAHDVARDAVQMIRKAE
jgi:hypothetical protein